MKDRIIVFSIDITIKLRIVWVMLLCLLMSLTVFAACDNTKSPPDGDENPPPQVQDVFAGITFSDETFTYDGTEKSLEVKNLPGGVSVVYENNSKTDAGSYAVSAKLTKDEEEKTLSATLTINKVPLVITAENKTVKYGTDLPEFTVTYSGFVNEETVSVLGGELAFEEMSASLPVGTYKITPKGLTANNYEIEYRKGNLTVTPQDLTGASIANIVTEFTSELTEIVLSASLLPHKVDAVEVFNGKTPDEFNARAKWYAQSYGLPETAGSDAHGTDLKRLTGIELSKKSETEKVIISAIRTEKIKLIDA